MSNVKSTTQVRALERFSYKRIQGLKYKTVFNNGYSQGITSAQKTFNKISHVAVLRWLPIGAIFLGIIAEVKNAESRFDFVVNVSTYTGSSTPNTVFLSVAS